MRFSTSTTSLCRYVSGTPFHTGTLYQYGGTGTGTSTVREPNRYQPIRNRRIERGYSSLNSTNDRNPRFNTQIINPQLPINYHFTLNRESKCSGQVSP